jgi:hypothetical protein
VAYGGVIQVVCKQPSGGVWPGNFDVVMTADATSQSLPQCVTSNQKTVSISIIPPANITLISPDVTEFCSDRTNNLQLDFTVAEQYNNTVTLTTTTPGCRLNTTQGEHIQLVAAVGATYVRCMHLCYMRSPKHFPWYS